MPVDAGLSSGALPSGVIVVLGCRVRWPGVPSATLARRIEEGVRAWREQPNQWLLFSGGRCWFGVPEAHVMRSKALECGVPGEQILCEIRSQNTNQNARFAKVLLRDRGIEAATLVTSDWHMDRACFAFERVGVSVTPVAAATPSGPRLGECLRTCREKLRLGWDHLVAALGPR